MVEFPRLRIDLGKMYSSSKARGSGLQLAVMDLGQEKGTRISHAGRCRRLNEIHLVVVCRL